MKKLTVGTIVLVLIFGAFAGGVYAANNWINFTGDAEIEESENHVDEVMEILRQVNLDRITAQEALEELEAMNPPGLVKQIKELKEEIKGLKEMNKHQAEYIAHLETELERANQKVSEINNKTTDAVEEAREIGDY